MPTTRMNEEYGVAASNSESELLDPAMYGSGERSQRFVDITISIRISNISRTNVRTEIVSELPKQWQEICFLFL